MNIDKLLEILQRTNQPMGSSTGRAIYQSLIKYKNEWLTSDFQRNLIETPDYLDKCKPV